MRFSWWFYTAKYSVFLFPVACTSLFHSAKSVVAQYIFIGSLGIIFITGFLGAVLGGMMILWNVKMRCPFCDRYGYVGGNKRQGMFMHCDDCGYVHGSGFMGLKLVCEELDEENEGELSAEEQ
jgi:hypothetical protein